ARSGRITTLAPRLAAHSPRWAATVARMAGSPTAATVMVSPRNGWVGGPGLLPVRHPPRPTAIPAMTTRSPDPLRPRHPPRIPEVPHDGRDCAPAAPPWYETTRVRGRANDSAGRDPGQQARVPPRVVLNARVCRRERNGAEREGRPPSSRIPIAFSVIDAE